MPPVATEEMTMEKFIAEAARLIGCAPYEITTEFLFGIIEHDHLCERCSFKRMALQIKPVITITIANEED